MGAHNEDAWVPTTRTLKGARRAGPVARGAPGGGTLLHRRRAAVRKGPSAAVGPRRRRLGDDALLHACVVAYASDLALLDSVLLPHDLTWADATVWAATLNHAVWFLRPVRADEWLLYDQNSPVAFARRGFAEGAIYSRDGLRPVSVIRRTWFESGLAS